MVELLVKVQKPLILDKLSIIVKKYVNAGMMLVATAS